MGFETKAGEHGGRVNKHANGDVACSCRPVCSSIPRAACAVLRRALPGRSRAFGPSIDSVHVGFFGGSAPSVDSVHCPTLGFWGYAPSVNSVHLPAESGGSGFARLLERRLVVGGLCESPSGKGPNDSPARFSSSGQEGRSRHKRHN